MQHFKYVAHLLRLENNSLEKQTHFSCSLLITAEKIEKALILDTIQIKSITQNKKECPSLLNNIYKWGNSDSLLTVLMMMMTIC